MRFFAIAFFLTAWHNAFGQDKTLLQLKKLFGQELKVWTKTFNRFNLSEFKTNDTLRFDNNSSQDFKKLKSFLSVYKPILTLLRDGSKFIDIYSYQLNLEKKGDHYEANPEIDQAVLLCDPKTKYWNRVYFGTPSQWIDEAVWLSKTKFILVGIVKSAEGKKKPLILLGDTDKQLLVKYLSTGKSTFQNDDGYLSPKLKRMKIEGL